MTYPELFKTVEAALDSKTSVLTLTSEALSEAIAVLRRLEAHAPDVGVDEFQDALRDARRLIAKAEGR